MTRNLVINGETMVKVKGQTGSLIASYSELGLADGQILVNIVAFHQDIHVDDYGPQTAAEVLAMGAEARISMTLVHFDRLLLEECLWLSLGAPFQLGMLPPVGRPLGAATAPFRAPNKYISLNLLSPVLGIPWRFPSAYLTGQPYEVPLGTGYSAVKLEWRAIAYKAPASIPGELTSDRAVLWYDTEDT